MPRTWIVAAVALAVTACGQDSREAESGTMQPGSDCLSCHGNGSGPAFAAAGTVYAQGGAAAQGVAVVVTVDGTPRTATTNSVGNFWFTGSGTVTAASAGAQAMAAGSITGHCNACHGTSSRIHP